MVRIFLTLLFAVAITQPIHAQAKPNTLTPKEIADGWILLFDGETTFGWALSNAAKAKVKADSGVLNLGTLAVEGISHTALFHQFELLFEYKSKWAAGVGLGYYGPDRKSFSRTGPVYPKSEEWVIGKIVVHNGEVTYFRHGLEPSKSRWSHRSAVIEIHQEEGFAAFQLRNIKLRPLNTTSLFNGKDLAGWNVFPGRKSKFAVVDNAINVKDGPGDLQTVGKYKDFVLQLEAISNGKHLNSGIFFRCRDGEYQNGYEAQIHNGFAETTKKYLLEEYDAKTNKLIGKKEAFYTATDFGTGAIYRRVPARKQMSKDGEWFGMTIVAQGNHFATWVNGIQVTDWTDNRPKSDNARTGCRLEAGHLSIQGHDPTTDLSFRNFRIAEIK